MMNNTSNNTSHGVLPEEGFFRPWPGSSSKKMVQRLERKPVNSMTNIVQKFCKAAKLVTDTCASTLCTVKACL